MAGKYRTSVSLLSPKENKSEDTVVTACHAGIEPIVIYTRNND